MFGIPQDSLDEIKKILLSYSGTEEAIIYGSRAKGNYRDGSDIDLAIKGNLNYRNLVEISVKLDDLNLPWKIDLSLYNQIENEALKKHIDQVGIVI